MCVCSATVTTVWLRMLYKCISVQVSKCITSVYGIARTQNAKDWTLGVSIPLPPACEAGALPFELNALERSTYSQTHTTLSTPQPQNDHSYIINCTCAHYLTYHHHKHSSRKHIYSLPQIVSCQSPHGTLSLLQPSHTAAEHFSLSRYVLTARSQGTLSTK